MTLRMFDFECPNGHEFEDLVDISPDGLITASCPTCHQSGKKLMSATRLDTRLGVNADAFPTLGDKWARIRHQRAAIDAKKVRDHGPDA